jgi:hypothetical protein
VSLVARYAVRAALSVVECPCACKDVPSALTLPWYSPLPPLTVNLQIRTIHQHGIDMYIVVDEFDIACSGLPIHPYRFS